LRGTYFSESVKRKRIVHISLYCGAPHQTEKNRASWLLEHRQERSTMDIKTAAQHLKADDFPMRIGMKFAQNTPIFQVDFDTKKTVFELHQRLCRIDQPVREVEGVQHGKSRKVY
jgi:hypothetical protein